MFGSQFITDQVTQRVEGIRFFNQNRFWVIKVGFKVARWRRWTSAITLKSSLDDLKQTRSSKLVKIIVFVLIQ